MPNIENEQINSSFVDEMQKDAGYLRRHHTEIKTFDELIRLDSLATKKASLQADIASKQEMVAKLDEVMNTSAAATPGK